MPASAPAVIEDVVRRVQQSSRLVMQVRYVDRLLSLGPERGVIAVRWAESEARVCDSDRAAACTEVRMSTSGSLKRIIHADVTVYVDRMRDLLRPILLHEFGHAVGLDHVEESSQIMYYAVGNAQDFNVGDTEGLRIAGQGTC